MLSYFFLVIFSKLISHLEYLTLTRTLLLATSSIDILFLFISVIKLLECILILMRYQFSGKTLRLGGEILSWINKICIKYIFVNINLRYTMLVICTGDLWMYQSYYVLYILDKQVHMKYMTSVLVCLHTTFWRRNKTFYKSKLKCKWN